MFFLLPIILIIILYLVLYNNDLKGSTASITFDKNKVIKRVTEYINYDVFEREIFWLKYLNDKGYDWCPSLLSYNKDRREMILTNVGSPINKHNAPNNWLDQLSIILSDLKQENIYHNDIRSDNLLVKGDKIYLIDYGWTSLGSKDWSCNGRFDNRRKPDHRYHDKNTINRISLKLR